MSRYMGKDFAGEELTGHRRFFTSRGLYRPEETRAESVGAILARLNIPDECKTFEVTYISNPLVGPVTYRHYDLRKRPPIRNHGAGGGRDDAEAYDTLIAVPYTDKEQSYLEI